MIAAGEAIVIRTAEEYLEIAARSARGGVPFPREDDMRLLLAAKEAGRLSWTAVQEFLFRTGGSSAAKDGQPLQRYFRDLATFWSHTAPSADDFFAVQYARMVFGRDTTQSSVIPN
jgi:3-hydroxy-9,10-secoandrosta-1,3,5(10)-triene-9,17-dione monooxygenase